MAITKNFKIGVTFCGEYREKYVSPLCNELLNYDEFSKDDIFFDEWHDYMINGVSGDAKLQKIYNEQCELVIVLLSPNYRSKPWTGNIEWPAVSALINNGEGDRICLLRVENANIDSLDGLFKNKAIVKDIDSLPAKDVARFIYNRWKCFHPTTRLVNGKNHSVNGLDLENISIYTDSQLQDAVYNIDNDATRRKICIKIITAHRSNTLIENCITSMNNNAEKLNLLKEIAENNLSDSVYFSTLLLSLENARYQSKAITLCIELDKKEMIQQVFPLIKNNHHKFEALLQIYDYDKSLFSELYNNGSCFCNAAYRKKVELWLIQTNQPSEKEDHTENIENIKSSDA